SALAGCVRAPLLVRAPGFWRGRARGGAVPRPGHSGQGRAQTYGGRPGIAGSGIAPPATPAPAASSADTPSPATISRPARRSSLSLEPPDSEPLSWATYWTAAGAAGSGAAWAGATATVVAA